MDLIISSGIPWGGLSTGSLLLLAVLLIFRGDLIPRKIHDEVRAELERQRELNDILLKQNSKLLLIGDLTVATYESINDKAKAAQEADNVFGSGR